MSRIVLNPISPVTVCRISPGVVLTIAVLMFPRSVVYRGKTSVELTM